mgnify:CR=1 FL=1
MNPHCPRNTYTGRDKGAYYHECFLRGRIDLTAKITSTRSSKGKKSNHLISSGSGSGTQQQLQTSTGTGSTPPQKKKFGAYALKAEPNFYHIPPVPKYGGPDLSTCIELVQVSVKDEAHVRATKIVEKVKPVEEEEDEKKEQEKTSSIKGEEENTPKTLVAKVDVDAAVPAPANSSKVACGNNITKVAEVTKKDMPGCDKGNTATKKRNMTKKASSSASKKAKRIATIKKAVGMLKSAPKESAVTMVEKRNDAAGKKEEVPVTPAGKKEIVLPTPSFAREHSLFLPGQNADVSNFSKHVMPQLRLVTPEKPGPKDPFILHAGCNGYHPSALLPDFDESSTDADYPRICFSDAASLEEENDDNEDMLTLSDLDAMLEHLEPSSGLLDDTEGGILSAYEGNDLDHHNSSLTSLLSMNYSAMQSTEIAESVSFMNYGNGIGGTTPCFPSIAPSPSTHNGCSGSSPAYRGSGYNLRISKRSTGMTSIYTDDVTGWVDSSSKMEL